MVLDHAVPTAGQFDLISSWPHALKRPSCQHLQVGLYNNPVHKSLSLDVVIVLLSSYYRFTTKNALSFYFLLIVFPQKTIKTEHGHVKTKLNSTGLLYSPKCQHRQDRKERAEIDKILHGHIHKHSRFCILRGKGPVAVRPSKPCWSLL